jgi:hypothetical protein
MTETLETVEPKTEAAPEVVLEETREELPKNEEKKDATEQGKPESEKESNAEVQAENQDDDDEIEWSQSAPKAEQTLDENKSTEQLGLENVEELKKQVESLKTENARLMADPLVKAYSEYLRSSDEPKVSEFLSQVGAISYDPTQGLQGEDLVRKRYEMDAQAAGLSGDDLNYAVEEEMQTYQNATMLGKRNLEKQAKEILTPKGAGKTVEDLESEFRQSRENKEKSINEWLTYNTNNVFDFLNKAVQKGKYNGRSVDSKWAERIKTVLAKSSDVFLSDFVRYTEPDKNGVSHLYAPDVVDYLDFALNREQFKKSAKRRVDSANASSLEEKAKSAHQTAIDTEKVAEKSKESDLKWFISYESQKGKRHPKDPRGEKS